MTFEQGIELAKVISPAFVGIAAAFGPYVWVQSGFTSIKRELDLIHKTQEIIVQDLKNIVNAIHDLDIRITKLEPK